MDVGETDPCALHMSLQSAVGVSEYSSWALQVSTIIILVNKHILKDLKFP